MRSVKRIVTPELLDELPPADPRAVHSRGDLRKLNWLMRHTEICCKIFATDFKGQPQVIAEVGAGDGTLMLKLAKRLHVRWPRVKVVLVDRQPVVAESTLAAFQKLGWQADVVSADVFDWVNSANRVDVVLANLFLHHFEDQKLSTLFRLMSDKTDFLLACETRRDWPSFAVQKLLGLIGCNTVTRHDALLSMRAGFLEGELSKLWPAGDGWKLAERRAVLFTHLFVAQRKD